MQLASGGGFTYSIFRPGGDSGFWTLGRTSAEDGIMVTLWNKFTNVEDAQNYAEEDYEVQTGGGDLPPEPQKS